MITKMLLKDLLKLYKKVLIMYLHILTMKLLKLLKDIEMLILGTLLLI